MLLCRVSGQPNFATAMQQILQPMKTNMGMLDRGLRLLLAAVVAGLYFAGQLTGTAAIVLLIFAGIFTLTSLLGFCPLYLPFGFSTKAKKTAGKQHGK